MQKTTSLHGPGRASQLLRRSTTPPQTTFAFTRPTAESVASPRAGRGALSLSPGAFGSGQEIAGAGPDLRYLVHHATMGFSVVEYFDALTLGWQGYLEKQLAYELIDDSELDAVLPLLPTLQLTPSQLLTQYPDEAVEQVVVELQLAGLLRPIYSKRQLYERMVAFWTDHFNVSQLDDLCLWFKTDDDREVVREHALRKFPDMLRASARSSAMSWYLDNYANFDGAPQENYARELMELHTLGVDGPYTEADIKEVARCFTGWTLDGIYTAGPVGEFVFVPELHDDGPKTVLGVDIPSGGGMSDGETVLNILASHPQTAVFVSTKMCRWLLGYEPPQSLVIDVTNIYLQTGGDIRSMVRAILDPNVVAAIPLEERTKLRQPLHFAISLLRAGFFSSQDLLQITFATQALGQTPYWWPSPDGPPDSLAKWGPSVLPRWDFASRLFGGQLPGNAPDVGILQFLMQFAPAGTMASRINWVLTGGLLSPVDEAGVQAFLDALPALSEAAIAEAFALAASSPSYQFF